MANPIVVFVPPVNTTPQFPDPVFVPPVATTPTAPPVIKS